jgi:hypothetical protein
MIHKLKEIFIYAKQSRILKMISTLNNFVILVNHLLPLIIYSSAVVQVYLNLIFKSNY